MEFRISRASLSGNGASPCEGAELKTDNTYGIPFKYWAIKIETLEDLIALSRKCGVPLIFDATPLVGDEDDLYITIYDDYVE